MAKEIFILGIGGTGMRCIESFIHLCAIGMFDKTDIHLLAMDTDKDNGNFKRLKELKESYLKTKGVNKNHSSLSDTFFSANLHYYQFSPDYSRKSNFESLFNYSDTKYKYKERSEIADLLLSKNTRTFDLKHGYRAQTHLGSMLMYHSIIDEVEQNPKSEIRKFVEILVNSSQHGRPKIFILGSVFGGTGASSIPIIPKALIKAASIIADAVDLQRNAYFGSTLLTGYFKFKLPADTEKSAQKVIASSEKFALNSQAAMMFYEADDTVKKTYQKFYMLGTDSLSWEPNKKANKTLTGGVEQENDSHFIELFSAFAAYDFFNMDENVLQDIKDNQKLEYVYRTIDESNKLTFSDFIGTEKKSEFAKKLGVFTALSFLTLLENYDFFQQAQNGGLTKYKISGYEDIDKEEVDNLKKYMQLFHFDFSGENLNDGWIRQLHRASDGDENFLFSPSLFGFTTKKEASKFSFNEDIFQKKSEFEKNKFKTSLFGGIFDKFFEEFLKIPEPEITNKCEKLIKRSYDTLNKLYNF